MKIAFRLVFLAALGGLGFWLWTVLFPSPEKLVLKKISSLAATATIGAADGNITRAMKVSDLIGYFSPDAQIVVDVEGLGQGSLNGSDEIRTAAAGVFAQLKAMKVTFVDAAVRLAADKQAAEVSCTGEVKVDGSKNYGVQELKFQLQLINREWRITRVETVKTLQ